MKNSFTALKNKLIYSNSLKEESLNNTKSTNINVLLNRVKLDQKKESRKKILLSAITSFGLFLFGVLIF